MVDSRTGATVGELRYRKGTLIDIAHWIDDQTMLVARSPAVPRLASRYRRDVQGRGCEATGRLLGTRRRFAALATTVARPLLGSRVRPEMRRQAA